MKNNLVLMGWVPWFWQSMSHGRSKDHQLPKIVRPMLPYLIGKPFDQKGWLFEIKWDGYRALAKVQGHQVEIFSRNQQSFNARFPDIVQALEKIDIDTAIFDGEIVVTDSQGRPHFQLMQEYQSSHRGNLCYYVFDLLYLNGRSLLHDPLIERKKTLQRLLKKTNCAIVRYSDHVEEHGTAFFEEASKNHLEGIICKNSQSHYLMGRSKQWLKVKVKMQQEVVIGGFTQPRGSRQRFGALLVGVYQGNNLIFAGRVGGGFSEQLAVDVYKELEPLIQDKCPFLSMPKSDTKATWIKPKLVGEVEFAEWTAGGIMRQPIFVGLRIDKKPKSVRREIVENIA